MSLGRISASNSGRTIFYSGKQRLTGEGVISHRTESILVNQSTSSSDQNFEIAVGTKENLIDIGFSGAKSTLVEYAGNADVHEMLGQHKGSESGSDFVKYNLVEDYFEDTNSTWKFGFALGGEVGFGFESESSAEGEIISNSKELWTNVNGVFGLIVHEELTYTAADGSGTSNYRRTEQSLGTGDDTVKERVEPTSWSRTVGGDDLESHDDDANSDSTAYTLGVSGVPEGGRVDPETGYVYDADGNLFGKVGDDGAVYWPAEWPEGFDGTVFKNWKTPPSWTGFPAMFLFNKTRSQILEGIPEIKRSMIPNRLPEGTRNFIQGGNSCWSGQIPPGMVVGPFGMSTCVGLVLRPVDLDGTFHSYHFGEADDLEQGLIRTGAILKGYSGEMTPEYGLSEDFIAYLAGGCELNKLRQTIDFLKANGIKIGGYLPCGTFAIDANGRLYWTHLGTNSTSEYEE